MNRWRASHQHLSGSKAFLSKVNERHPHNPLNKINAEQWFIFHVDFSWFWLRSLGMRLVSSLKSWNKLSGAEDEFCPAALCSCLLLVDDMVVNRCNIYWGQRHSHMHTAPWKLQLCCTLTSGRCYDLSYDWTQEMFFWVLKAVHSQRWN